jgi:putative protease
LDLHVEAIAGQKLRVQGRAASGATCRVESDEVLAKAIKHPLTDDILRAQLGRLGGSVYQLNRLEAQTSGQPMVPLSVLGKLRREVIRQLDECTATPPPRWMAAPGVLSRLRSDIADRARECLGLEPPPCAGHRAGEERSVLRVLCRTPAQLRSVLDCGVREVLADFQDIREYRLAVELAHQRNAAIYLATPRIQKPDEAGIFRALARHGADGILARNLAAILYFAERQVPCVADYSCNAANELTVAFLRELGAARVTASYDLNRDQLLDLVAATPPGWLDVVIHQHMPMFHMEHCVFCAVLSPGTNKHNCGRPCDAHEVKLRDRIGSEHPLKADVGCRNTLFNSVPQSSAELVPKLLDRGIRNFRIELLDHGPDEVARTITLYLQLLEGKVSSKQVWHQLQAANRVGVTRGTLEDRRNPLAII